jgi:hypothetical protein
MFFLFISICPSLFLYTFLPLFSHFYLSPMKNMLGFTQTWRKEISHCFHSPPLLSVLHPRRKNLLIFSCPNLIKLGMFSEAYIESLSSFPFLTQAEFCHSGYPFIEQQSESCIHQEQFFP